jgi:hypothetical protein
MTQNLAYISKLIVCTGSKARRLVKGHLACKRGLVVCKMLPELWNSEARRIVNCLTSKK